jgi:phosphatidylinositol glycan class A protein
VGGIPEILPDSMITLCEPSVSDLIDKLNKAILKINSGDRMDPIEMHEKIKKMYNWRDVAKRTEIVYDRVAQCEPSKNLLEILLRFKTKQKLLNFKI